MNKEPDIPVSVTQIKCFACQELAQIFVCFCGRDICVPCAVEHQAHCGYAQQQRLRDQTKKATWKEAM